jgi:hypothetical protein
MQNAQNYYYMKSLYQSLALLSLIVAFTNCKKDTKDPEPEPIVPPVTTPATPGGGLQIEFEGMVGDSDLVLSAQTYTNQAGNTFNITLCKYYISNIKLTKNDNSVWSEPNSYHLIDYSDALSTIVEIPNVPYSDYKAIEFMIGVDSARNVSGAQTGALDPVKGMFWSWNSGYIMAKMEGTSPQSTATANKLTIHVGGFSGSNSVLKTVSPSFNGNVAKVTSAITPKIHLKCDIMEWFQSPNTISFSTLNTVHMPGTDAKKVGDNYADMFSVEHIHND